jgi:hypothetical protein
LLPFIERFLFVFELLITRHNETNNQTILKHFVTIYRAIFIYP